MLVHLRFTNRTDSDEGPPRVVEMQINREAVPSVMDWYGAFYAGDDYDVRLNGKKLRMGINGELELPTIDAAPVRLAIGKKE